MHFSLTPIYNKLKNQESSTFYSVELKLPHALYFLIKSNLKIYTKELDSGRFSSFLTSLLMKKSQIRLKISFLQQSKAPLETHYRSSNLRKAMIENYLVLTPCIGVFKELARQASSYSIAIFRSS